MEVLYLVTWFVLLPVNCLGRVYSASEERLLSKDIAHSNDLIFTAKSPGDNLISEDNKIVNSPATDNENEVQQKQLDANQPNNNFMRRENLGEKNDESGTMNTKQQKQQYSNQPIFTVDNPGYNPIKEEDEKVKKKSLKSMVKKLFPGDRKGSYHKARNSDDTQNDESVTRKTDDNEWSFIHKPYKPDKTEDTDAESSSSSSKLGKVASKIWSSSSSPRSPLSRSSSTSSSSTDDRDREIDSLLDEYDRKSDHVETDYAVEQENNAIVQAEAIELPHRSSNITHNKMDFSGNAAIKKQKEGDGKAPTCIFACLYYKIKNLVFQIEPAGRCARYKMNGPSNGAPANTYVSCICGHGLRLFGRKYRYRIVQEGDILYSVQSKELGTKLPLGTAKQIHNYVEKNFEPYLIQFLKEKRGVDWQGMYEYVRDLRWNRHDKDDRSVGQYLSESLKEEIDDIKHYWTVTIPSRLLKLGISRTPYY